MCQTPQRGVNSEGQKGSHEQVDFSLLNNPGGLSGGRGLETEA